MRPLLLTLFSCILLAACSEVHVASHLFKKAGGASGCSTVGIEKVGNPYLVDGIRYEPINSSASYREKGIASWYGSDFHGKATANGECYNMYAFTAAHKTLPLPTIARVTNLENNRSIVVKINDRGPFVRGRLIDLSYAASQSLGMVGNGTAPVLVEAIGGPFHKDSNSWFASNDKPQMPGQKVQETLPSFVPETAEEEELSPLTPQQMAEQTKAERNLGVPEPKTSLPKPPPYEKRMFTDTAPLKHTQVYVQVGAFGEEPRAEVQKQALSKLYPTATISRYETPERTLLRVRAGPFRSIADADAALEKLANNGFPDAQLKVEE